MKEAAIATAAASEPALCPSSEELRMVRAIALLALQEAARHGEYRATFHGFRVQALRKCLAPGSETFVEVNLRVSLGKTVIERSLVATTDADVMEPKP